MSLTEKSCQGRSQVLLTTSLGLSSYMDNSNSALSCTDRFALEYHAVIGHNAIQDRPVEAAASRQSDHAMAGQDEALVGVLQHGLKTLEYSVTTVEDL